MMYGPFRNWYMWDPKTLYHHCWQLKGGSRFIGALRDWRNATNYTAPYAGVVPKGAWVHECFRGGSVGPFPFIAGSFTAFSIQLLRELMPLPQLASDEAFILGNRSTQAQRNPADGKWWKPGKLGHPARYVFYEDVYYGYLIFTTFTNKSVHLVNAPISEYRRAPPSLFNAHVYHKLKTPDHFGYVRNHSSELLRVSVKSYSRCDPAWGKKLFRFVRHCRNWTFCAFNTPPGSTTQQALKQGLVLGKIGGGARSTSGGGRKRPRSDG